MFLKQKNFIYFALVALCLTGLGFYKYFRNSPARVVLPDNSGKMEERPVPDGYFGDLPVQGDARVIKNYQSDIFGGGKQTVRIFVSKKNLVENYNLYKNFFTQNGWEIRTDNIGENAAYLEGFAKAKEFTVQITQSGETQVNLSILEK